MSDEHSRSRVEAALAKPTAAARETALGFTAGFRCLFRGLRLAYADHRELARFYLPPTILGIAILVGGWIAFAHAAPALVSWIWPEPSPEAWCGIEHLLWSALAFLVWAALALASLALFSIVFTVAAAPFNDILSERVEGVLGTWTPRPFDLRFLLGDLGHTVLLELARAGIKLAWLVPLFVGSLVVPVVGQIAYAVVGGLVMARLLGMDCIDWSLARRGYAWKERLEFARAHRWAVAGLGTALLLALAVPLLYVVVWPGAVAGGTILCIELGPEDRRDVDPSGRRLLRAGPDGTEA